MLPRYPIEPRQAVRSGEPVATRRTVSLTVCQNGTDMPNTDNSAAYRGRLREEKRLADERAAAAWRVERDRYEHDTMADLWGDT